VTKLTHFPPIIAQNSWFLLPTVKAMCGRERFADFSKVKFSLFTVKSICRLQRIGKQDS